MAQCLPFNVCSHGLEVMCILILLCCSLSFCSYMRRWHVHPGMKLFLAGEGEFFRISVLTWHSLTKSRLLVFWSVTLTPCFFKSYCLLLLKYMMAFCQFLYLWVRIVSFSPYFHLNLSICGNFEPAIKRDAFYIIFCIHPQNSNAV